MPTGRNTVTAFAEQASKGSAASTLDQLRATSNSLAFSVSTTQSEALLGKRFTDDQYVTGKAVGGSVDLELDTDTIALLVKHAIGAEDTAPEDINADASFFRHLFSPAQDAQLAGWLTFLKYIKDDAYWERFEDCRINQLTFNLTSQAIITMGMDILGITGGHGTGVPTETINAESENKLFAWQADFLWKGGSIKSLVDDFSFTHNNNLDGEDYGLSQTRRSLDPQDGEHTISLTTQFSASDFDAMVTDLEEGNVITLDVEIGETNGGADPILKLVYPKLKISDVGSPISGGGKITIDLSATALWDNTAGYNVGVELVDETGTQY